MSQLKLRAWDELNKVMHYDFEYIATGSEGDDWIIFKSDKQTLKDGNVFDNPYMRKQFHIMQSTDAFDKNGKEIYEEDLIKLNGKGPLDEYPSDDEVEVKDKILRVRFLDGTWWLCNLKGKYRYYTIMNYVLNDDFKIEVVGNTFENEEDQHA